MAYPNYPPGAPQQQQQQWQPQQQQSGAYYQQPPPPGPPPQPQGPYGAAPRPAAAPAAAGAAAGGPMGFAVPAPHANEEEQQLREWFTSVAKGGDTIGPDELREALSTPTFRFRASTAEKIVRMFDKQGGSRSGVRGGGPDGALDFNEFCAVRKFLKTMSDSFSRRDTDGSGVLEGNEVREALATSGFRLSEPCFQLLMKRFDRSTPRQGGLLFDSYLEVSVLLAQAGNAFAFYDRNRSGLVTMDFSSALIFVLSSAF